KEWREKLKKMEKLRHEKNIITDEIARTKKKVAIMKVKKISKQIKSLEEDVDKLRCEIDTEMMKLPNILHNSVPKGRNDEDNTTLRKWGKIPKFNFKPLGHEQIMEKLNLGDIERATKISGARFYFLKNELAMMDFALMIFAIDFLTKKGYELLHPPLLMRRKPYEGVVDMGDFEDVMYKIEDEDLYLIATSEHPMVSMHQGEVLDEKKLPKKYVGWSTNFRKEAGTHGKDTKGIFRTHQFNKVEQVIFCKPEDSWKVFEEIIKNKEEMTKKLEIPYRVVSVCTGDIGNIAAKKVDIEGWMPAQKKYRELTSASNCTDYQARRLGIRYGIEGKKPTGTPHILNSTALATGRTMVAILENNQQKDGSVKIPDALVPFMGGLTKIIQHPEIIEKEEKIKKKLIKKMKADKKKEEK
ncbi:MAG: serine--tRNA ligase, partial [Nanoarchaeota archaeon]